jgi:MFS family permease
MVAKREFVSQVDQTNATLRLDRLPWGRFHTNLVIALSFGWMLDQFEANITGNVLGVLTKNWKLTTVQASYAVSAWVFGILIGALLFGYLADRLGRKKMFFGTLILYAVCCLLTSMAWNYTSFLCLRIITAIGVGGEYSVVISTMVEFIPIKHRGKTDSLIMSATPLGAVLASLVSSYLLLALPSTISWRLAFGLGVVLAVMAIWIRFVVPESPRWLISNHRNEDALKIVERVALLPYKFWLPDRLDVYNDE